MMVTFANDPSVEHDHGPDGRIGSGAADAARGEFVGALEIEAVARVSRPEARSTRPRFSSRPQPPPLRRIRPPPRPRGGNLRALHPSCKRRRSRRRGSPRRVLRRMRSAPARPGVLSRSSSLRVPGTPAQRLSDARRTAFAGVAREQRDAVHASDARPLGGRRHRNEEHPGFHERRDSLAQRLGHIATPVFQRENRGAHDALVRGVCRYPKVRKPHADRGVGDWRAGATQTASERVATGALRWKEEIEHRAPCHVCRSRERALRLRARSFRLR